jgi:hypothetical protein
MLDPLLPPLALPRHENTPEIHPTKSGVYDRETGSIIVRVGKLYSSLSTQFLATHSIHGYSD